MSTKQRPPTRRDKIILRVATPLGLVLVVGTWIGNARGFNFLPFDQHHVIGQVLGFILILYGLMHWR